MTVKQHRSLPVSLLVQTIVTRMLELAMGPAVLIKEMTTVEFTVNKKDDIKAKEKQTRTPPKSMEEKFLNLLSSLHNILLNKFSGVRVARRRMRGTRRVAESKPLSG
jgi:hypothetical protein